MYLLVCLPLYIIWLVGTRKYYSKRHFEKFVQKPVKNNPFNPESKRVAKNIVKKLRKRFPSSNYDIFLLGSTAYEISGVGDIEIAIVPPDKNWKRLVEELKKKYGKPEREEKDFVSFSGIDDGFEVNIEAIKKSRGLVEKKQLEYMLKHPNLVREYEELKKKYSFSKREYKYQKFKFFLNVKRKMG